MRLLVLPEALKAAPKANTATAQQILKDLRQQ